VSDRSMFGPLTGPGAMRNCGICNTGFTFNGTDWWKHPVLKWCCAGCGATDPWRRKQIARVGALIAQGKAAEAIAKETGLGYRIVVNIRDRLAPKVS